MLGYAYVIAQRCIAFYSWPKSVWFGHTIFCLCNYWYFSCWYTSAREYPGPQFAVLLLPSPFVIAGTGPIVSWPYSLYFFYLKLTCYLQFGSLQKVFPTLVLYLSHFFLKPPNGFLFWLSTMQLIQRGLFMAFTHFHHSIFFCVTSLTLIFLFFLCFILAVGASFKRYPTLNVIQIQ